VEATGVEPPKAPFTWEEYGSWLRQVQSKLPDGVYATENDGGFMFTFASWVVGHGEDLFTDGELGFTEETLADYFQFWLDLTEEGVALPPAEIPTQYESMEIRPLAKGTAASGFRDIPGVFLTESAIKDAGGHTSIVSVSNPTDTDESANVVGANGISIPEECDNVTTAASFVDFFTNDVEAAKAFKSDNGVLTNTEAQAALLASNGVDDTVTATVKRLQELEESGDLTSATYPAGSTTITADLLRLYQEVAFGRLNVDEAVDQFFTSADRALG
jgi:multiple sugar transport system substrate-binding protein